jgi:choline dehydrogenase-like flavoprotein
VPRAIARGARFYSRALVQSVTVNGDRAVGVRGRMLQGSPQRRGARFAVRARTVVLAAGAYYSPLLLLRSGFGRSSEHVGRNLTLHPSFRVVARFAAAVNGERGALQSAYSDAFAPDFTLISIFTPPGVAAAAIPGAGAPFRDAAAELEHLAMFGGLIHDQAGGRVHHTPFGPPLVTYRMSARDRTTVSTMLRLMAETFLAAGATHVFLPVLGGTGVDADALGRLDLDRIPGRLLESASQHPLGSCRMGTSPDHSVVDPDGRVWQTQGLYVVDGSVLPTSLGVNPQIAVMAMALRMGRGIADVTKAGASR